MEISWRIIALSSNNHPAGVRLKQKKWNQSNYHKLQYLLMRTIITVTMTVCTIQLFSFEIDVKNPAFLKKIKSFANTIVPFLTVINFLLILLLFCSLYSYKKDAWQLWIQGISAIGTLVAVFAAIFQDWIRRNIFPPQLKIELHNSEGVVVPSGEGGETIFFHLKVVNNRKWSGAKNCEVLLVEVKTKLADNDFSSIPLAVPRKLEWTPASQEIVGMTIFDEAVFDLVRIETGEMLVKPCVKRTWRDRQGNFIGFINPGEVKQYVIRVVAENTPSSKQTIQISWDGIWPENSAGHLVIKEVVE